MGDPPAELIMLIPSWVLFNNTCFAHFDGSSVTGCFQLGYRYEAPTQVHLFMTPTKRFTDQHFSLECFYPKRLFSRTELFLTALSGRAVTNNISIQHCSVRFHNAAWCSARWNVSLHLWRVTQCVCVPQRAAPPHKLLLSFPGCMRPPLTCAAARAAAETGGVSGFVGK